ncbi:L-lactate dehydrogenase [Staphylococcus sp. NAM3COL9]|uniref:L-lactate dehydrogenase n=1 Tax=Staphylococcus sp. NAM3COL9 TaxID=1667172 RepID=UPI00070C73D0|nr:L-lactate dehydrogenase [Staphylococcus sp. NAM3COL9]KRG10466.1 lactate dehydrogenase [Staphylococcus sp. NAM3COL9]
MKQVKNNKVVLIGDGAVGSSYAFALVAQSAADELVIIDLDEEKVRGDVMDLNHGAPYGDLPVKIKAGTYNECTNADLVVITAGAAQKPGETRLDLIEKNTKIFKGIVSEVMKSGFNGIFLIATNPVDVLTYVTYKVSGLSKEKVIGSGTILDTARFKYELAKEFGISPNSVHGQIIGEHGDSELAVWSQANIAGQSLYQLLQDDPEKQHRVEEIFTNTRDAAYDIIQAKGSTYYGIAMGLLHITKAILNNQNIVLTISSYLEGEYNQKDVYIGVPTQVNKEGAVKVFEMSLDSHERELLEKSAAILKEMQNKISHIIA